MENWLKSLDSGCSKQHPAHTSSLSCGKRCLIVLKDLFQGNFEGQQQGRAKWLSLDSMRVVEEQECELGHDAEFVESIRQFGAGAMVMLCKSEQVLLRLRSAPAILDVMMCSCSWGIALSVVIFPEEVYPKVLECRI